MRAHPVLLAALILGSATLGAAEKLPARLAGKWIAKIEVDEAKVKALFQEQGLPAEAGTQALKAVKQQLSGLQVTIVVNADGTTNGVVAGLPGQQPKEEKSDWSVVEEKGKILKIKSTDSDGETTTLTLEFLTDDKFRLSVPELEQAPVRKPVFIRQKKE